MGGVTLREACRSGARIRALGYLASAASCSFGVLALLTTNAAADWRAVPSVDVDETYNDNVNLAPKGSALWDMITSISPGINLSDEGARVKFSLDYDPQELIFARGTSSNSFRQRLQGAGQAELIPEALFFDLNASIDQEFLSTAQPVAATTLTSSNNLQTVETFNASPYLRHHFGDIADTETRYRYGMVDTGGGTVAPDQINEFTQTITSGEDFGRLSWTALGDINRIKRLSGTSDPLSGTSSKDDVGRLDLKYPVYEALSLIAGGGYERISDPTLSVQPSGPIWDAGFQYQPNPKASLTMTYGKRLGNEDLSADGLYNVSADLQIHAGYTKSLQTGESLVASNVNQIVVGPNGTLVNAQTGLPVIPGNAPFGSGSSVFGLSSSSFIDRRLYFDLQWIRERNTYTLSAYDDRASGQEFGGSQRVQGGGISWARQLRPNLTGNVGGNYAQISVANGTGEKDTYYSASLGLGYNLSPTAVAQLQMTRSDRESNIAGNSVIDDLVMVSLRKSF